MTGSVAESYYARPDELEALFSAVGLTPTYTRIEDGDASSGDQDLYLAVLRRTDAEADADAACPPRTASPRRPERTQQPATAATAAWPQTQEELEWPFCTSS